MNPLVVFFDGECALCNSQVQLVLDLDKRQRISFAPLQGKTAERIWQLRPELRPEPGGSFNSMVAVRDLETDVPRIWLRSDAALEIAKEVGGPMSLFGICRLVPRPIRDGVYNFIARNRYRWFGKAETCQFRPDIDPTRFLE